MMNPSRHDYETEELLSAYLDNAVTEQERALVEDAIAQDSEMAWRLEMLRHTVSLLQQLPELQPPRSFGITEAMVASAASPPTQALASAHGPSRRTLDDLRDFLSDFFQSGSPLLRNFAAASLAAFLILVGLGFTAEQPARSNAQSGVDPMAAQLAAPADSLPMTTVGTAADDEEEVDLSSTAAANGERNDAPVAELDAEEAPAVANAPEAGGLALSAASVEEGRPVSAAQVTTESPTAGGASRTLQTIIGAGDAGQSVAEPESVGAVGEQADTGADESSAPSAASLPTSDRAGATVATTAEDATDDAAVQAPPASEVTGANRAPLWYVQMIALSLAALFAVLWLISRRGYAPAI